MDTKVTLRDNYDYSIGPYFIERQEDTVAVTKNVD